ncbi:DUF4214 domain-containing protein [Massilia aurea]|uniref:DUF4214 domain-containing protein n=1 Tax=Massilia aurea TaxID=373040 RepID=UPI003461CB23
MANTIDIQQLYVAYFNRPADAAGLTYWSGVLDTNPNALQDISRAFAASAEYRAEYVGDSNREIVDEVYENLFNRDADAAGLNYWTDLLNRNIVTIDNVVAEISAAAVGNDKIVFDGKVAVAALFTERLDLPNEQAAYAGNAAIDLVEDFLETIKDQATVTAALSTGAVDWVISRVLGANTFGADIELVGVQTDIEPAPVF